MDQLRSLRVFVQVVNDGSFAAAARSLDLAPAVVTRAVADLEDHLGARLLNRSTRRLALTLVGETYLERARQLLADLDDADQHARDTMGTPSGCVRILCPPAFATHQVMPQLHRLRQAHPSLHLELLATGPVHTADAHVDLSIISVGQQALQGEFVVRLLAQSHFLLCAAPAYLARRGPLHQPADLLHHDGLLPDVTAVRRELTLFRMEPTQGEAEGAQAVMPLALNPPVLVSSQLEVLHAAALAGMGVAGLPSFMVAQALRSGQLVQVLPDWHGGLLHLYASLPTRKHLPQRTRLTLNFLVEAFGGVAQDPWRPRR